MLLDGGRWRVRTSLFGTVAAGTGCQVESVHQHAFLQCDGWKAGLLDTDVRSEAEASGENRQGSIEEDWHQVETAPV